MDNKEVTGGSNKWDHPAHYNKGSMECLQAMRGMQESYGQTVTPFTAWLCGEVLKYLWRFPYKGGVEDLKKARFYLDAVITYLGG